MAILTTLFPVFFMIALGFAARVRQWITAEQKDGARKLVFGVLFPILIFNAIFTSQLSPSTAMIVLYVTIAFIAAIWIGKLTGRLTGEKYAHVSPFLLTTCEGGNVALPLYTTIVGAGYAINTVTFDMAGTIIAFILIPAMVTASVSGNMNLGDLLKKTAGNSFVIAAASGLILNLLGVYGMMEGSILKDLYTGAVSTALAPISGTILFTIGYDLNADASMIKSIVKLALMRVLIGVAIILGFFVLFPQLMADPIYRIAVILYFMSPTGFAIPAQIKPLCKDESDDHFMSSFISLFMIITLAVYTGLVLVYG